MSRLVNVHFRDRITCLSPLLLILHRGVLKTLISLEGWQKYCSLDVDGHTMGTLLILVNCLSILVTGVRGEEYSTWLRRSFWEHLNLTYTQQSQFVFIFLMVFTFKNNVESLDRVYLNKLNLLLAGLFLLLASCYYTTEAALRIGWLEEQRKWAAETWTAVTTERGPRVWIQRCWMPRGSTEKAAVCFLQPLENLIHG